MLYPDQLIPNSIETFNIDNVTLTIPKCIKKFIMWSGKPILNSFGNKAVINFEGEPMFAELAIMNIFIKNGWSSRWIETYGKPKMFPIYLTEWLDKSYIEQLNNPIENSKINTLLNSIAAKNSNKFGGCWDTFSWKDDFIIFTESKRSKKDSIRTTQYNWLIAAIEIGLKRENFLMVEWDFEED